MKPSERHLQIGLFSLICLGWTLSLISLVAWDFPWELISHFQLQVGVAALLLVGLSFGLRQIGLKQRTAIGLALALLGLNVARILPWYLPHSLQSSGIMRDSAELRLLSANLNLRNLDYASTVAMVRQQHPDLALFIEVTPDWIAQLELGLKDQMPYHFAGPGLAIWSRLPLRDPRAEKLGADDYSLLAAIEVDQQPLELVGTHLMVPFRPDLFMRRNRQLEGLSQFIQQSPAATRLVIGDFNLTPWSPYYGRFIRQTRLHNAQLGFGIHPTYPRASSLIKFPGWLVPVLQIPIDHALISQQLRVANFQTVDHGDADHAAILVDIVMDIGAKAQVQNQAQR